MGFFHEIRERRILPAVGVYIGSWIQWAKLEQSSGNIDAAIGYAGNYIEARPEDLAGELLLGDLLMEAGRLPEARQHYEEAQLLDDPPVTPTLRLALLAMLQNASGNAQMALASINYALAIWHVADPDYVDYRDALVLRDQLAASLH